MKEIYIDARMINSSGIGTYIKNILPIILENNKKYSIYLIGKKDELSYLNDRFGIEVIENNSSIYSIKEQISLLKLSRRADLFFSPHYNIPILSRNLVVTVHDLFHLDNPQWVSGIMKKLYAKIMFRLVDKRSECIITVSNFSKNRYLNLINSDKNILVSYNGINKKWFNIQKNKEIHNKPYLLFVGNVKPHKNLKNLLQAFKLIKDNYNHDLIIVGRKEGFLTGDKEINLYMTGIEDRVKFTGYIDDEVLMKYVSKADLFIFPSLYEGFGLPPLEAMAAGCPTIVSNIPPIKEVCGEATVYFNPEDVKDIAQKIDYVLSHPILMEDLRTKGIERAKTFTWESCAMKILNVFEEVLENENSNRP